MSIISKTTENNDTNNDENKCPSPFMSPCVCSINVWNEGCAGCDQWEKHYGTDCGEMMFCLLPCTSIIDTVSLFVTIPKWIYQKTCKK